MSEGFWLLSETIENINVANDFEVKVSGITIELQIEYQGETVTAKAALRMGEVVGLTKPGLEAIGLAIEGALNGGSDTEPERPVCPSRPGPQHEGGTGA